MRKYAEYDEKLLDLIRNGCNNFDALCRRLREESKPFVGSTGHYWLVVERRMQALRKAGKISYDRSRQVWHVGAYS